MSRKICWWKAIVEMRKRIFWISLICFVVAIILILTLQGPDETIAESVSAQEWLTRIMRRLTGDVSWQISVQNMRRLAHVVEYCILGFVVCIGLNRISGRICRSAWTSVAVCFMVSLMDQIIKHMLPTRHFDAFDLVLDAAGYVTAAAIVTIVVIIIGARNQQRG